MLEVGTITLSAEDVPVTLNLSGVAVASESAQIRPLVQGIVQEILYRPDQQMEPGDEMFQIDPTSYEAALASAEANLQSLALTFAAVLSYAFVGWVIFWNNLHKTP